MKKYTDIYNTTYSRGSWRNKWGNIKYSQKKKTNNVIVKSLSINHLYHADLTIVHQKRQTTSGKKK